MPSNGTYYQFNLDFSGSYIRGYFTSTTPQEPFFTITQPTCSNANLDAIIKPINNKIQLLKNAVVCYFEVCENQI